MDASTFELFKLGSKGSLDSYKLEAVESEARKLLA